MAGISLKKSLAPSILLAGAVFSSLTVPLVLTGSEPLVVQLKEEPLFVGNVKDIAAPYIGLAAAISLGAGIVNISIAGWKQSAKKSQKVEEQLSHLHQQLQEKEKQLEAVLVSESRLQAAGLSFFLDEMDAETDHPSVAAANTSVTPALTLQSGLSAIQSPAYSEAGGVKAHNGGYHSDVPTLVTSLQNAQTALDHAFTSASASTRQTDGAAIAPTTGAASQVKQLQDQLKQLVDQVEQLQTSLQEPQPLLEQLDQPEFTNIVLHHLSNRLHKLESQWAVKEVAS